MAKCKERNFRPFLFGMSLDVPTFKDCVDTSDLKKMNWSK